MITAQQGSMGLELARQHQPDLVLLDLHLPDMNGDQVLVWLRSEPRTRKIPVVVISADAVNSEMIRLKELGARAYITKPFEVRHFLEIVDEMLTAPEQCSV
jgi:CheY-like chemotaxis protein